MYYETKENINVIWLSFISIPLSFSEEENIVYIKNCWIEISMYDRGWGQMFALFKKFLNYHIFIMFLTKYFQTKQKENTLVKNSSDKY